MQCECNVIMLRISESIDSWNDKPKHPIIASGANRYLTSGEMMTANKFNVENWVDFAIFACDSRMIKCKTKRATYSEMSPIDQRDIENTRWKSCSNQRSASNRLGFLLVHPAGFVDHAQWTKWNGLNNIGRKKSKIYGLVERAVKTKLKL